MVIAILMTLYITLLILGSRDAKLKRKIKVYLDYLEGSIGVLLIMILCVAFMGRLYTYHAGNTKELQAINLKEEKEILEYIEKNKPEAVEEAIEVIQKKYNFERKELMRQGTLKVFKKALIIL